MAACAACNLTKSNPCRPRIEFRRCSTGTRPSPSHHTRCAAHSSSAAAATTPQARLAFIQQLDLLARAGA